MLSANPLKEPVAMTAPAPAPPPVANQPPAANTPPADQPLGAPGLKALQTERDRADALEAALRALQGGGDAAAAAAAATKAQRDAEGELAKTKALLQEYEEKGKTEEQKRAEREVKLAQERDTATVKALRYEVCAQPEINLPLAAAQFLTGTTQAEIEASAKALKALGAFGGATPPITPGLPPSPNAGSEPPKVGKADAGLAEARKRFGDLVK